MSTRTLHALSVCFAVGLSACRTPSAPRQSELNEAFADEEFTGFFAGMKDAKIRLDDLPKEAILTGRGWPAHYWPSYRWGVGWRYFGQEQAPIEKFESAFGDLLAKENSEYKVGDLTQYEHNRTLNKFTTWYGICDGSSEASLFFDEPTTVKVINGVTFYPHDIKALLSYFTAMFGERKHVFAGNRVRFDDPHFNDDGRGIDSRFRDINPGLFHLALANYLGIQHQGVVADIVPGRVVLNFPLVAYRVEKMEDVTGSPDFANAQKYNKKATKFVHLETAITYGDSHRVLEPIPGVDHFLHKKMSYVLELNANGEILGGEWLGESAKDHPDFIWAGTSPALDVSSFETTRLEKKLRVGAAVEALLAAPDYKDGAKMIHALIANPENLTGFQLFEATTEERLLPPPEDAKVQDLLRTTKDKGQGKSQGQ